jgi:hypothetical protein
MTQLTGSKVHAESCYALYHKDIFIPVHLRGQELNILKFIVRRGIEHTAHSFERMQAKGLPDVSIADILAGHIFEYKLEGKNLIEVGVRISGKTFDLCVIINADGYIETIYGRHKDDVAVADASRYASL